jgi:hypothetical protein
VGHESIHEVDLYVAMIRVEPIAGQPEITVAHGRHRRRIAAQDRATIYRGIRFGRKTKCSRRFELHYRTYDGGYVRGTTSGGANQAPSALLNASEETGQEAYFHFVPSPGRTYHFKVDVLNGYGPGNRTWHLHAGNHTNCKEYHFLLDLRAYLAVGYRLCMGPTLHVHGEDPGDHNLCAGREWSRSLPPLDEMALGFWRWSLTDVKSGVFHLEWDLKDPASPVAIHPQLTS